MDSLTQIVLGAAVGEAVLGKKVGNKAMLYGAIAGTIPDLDVLSRYLVDTVTAIEWHRGFSHSIVFAALFAPVFGWLISCIERKKPVTWKNWSWLMFWGLFTHPILDAFTTWGTQIFWPFETRLAFQSIFVIDPLYTTPFLVFLILAIRQKRGAPKRKRYNQMGLTVSSTYLLITLILKGIAFTKFTNNLDSQHIDYRKIDIRPTPFNTILWTANIETKDAYLIGNYSFFDSRPIAFKAYPKNHGVLGALRDKDKIVRLIKIAEGWYTITRDKGKLLFNNLRFGLISLDSDEQRFVFSYEVIQKENDIRVKETEKFNRDGQKLISALWKRMLGN